MKKNCNLIVDLYYFILNYDFLLTVNKLVIIIITIFETNFGFSKAKMKSSYSL